MVRPTLRSLRDRFSGRRSLVFGLLVALLVPGCGHEAPIQFKAESKAPSVELTQPKVRNIVRVVGQPSFIEAYERTSIYSKPSAYIKKWLADIGDKVKKDQPLAYLFVPELEEDHDTKKATVVLDQERIDLAEEVVRVAMADVKAAEARLKEAEEILDKYQAEVDRWDAEVTRLRHQISQDVVSSRVLLESEHQLKSSIAARDKAKATIKRAEAELRSKRATLAKAEVDVRVAEADLKVAESEERRLKAWVGYLTLTAPFDGVITVRNANTFDFLLPTTGDPTAHHRDPQGRGLSPSGSAAAIYVVDRTDVVRIFVDIPEQDANYVHVGTKASILVKAYRDEEIPATVTRTSWALNSKSRTLRAEIDIPNPGSQLLPGMYAYAKVIIERSNVRALPAAALTYNEDRTYCWIHEDGRAVRTELQTGSGDGDWVEVTSRQVTSPESVEDPWVPISGKEQVILGDLTLLADGVPVQITPASGTARLVTETAQAAPSPANPGGGDGPVEVSNQTIGAARREL
jgi:multidrug efflux pump subunit AcrA (membrane-fusion protein)